MVSMSEKVTQKADYTYARVRIDIIEGVCFTWERIRNPIKEAFSA